MDDPLTGYIRVKAICVFRNDGWLLAIDDFDPTKQQRFWVPVGGRVEFGETSNGAIRREVAEELSAEITDLGLLGVLENLFIFDGDDGHEIVFVYDARFVDESIYIREQVTVVEGDKTLIARWIDPVSPARGWPLYPEGLAELLGNTPT
ncbi:MAG: NUDIX domain-containing protein [Gammaproteobacteria bacterium]|nr:NUDIX domain-containing protein [Gammaproteobacteria bacterium]